MFYFQFHGNSHNMDINIIIFLATNNKYEMNWQSGLDTQEKRFEIDTGSNWQSGLGIIICSDLVMWI